MFSTECAETCGFNIARAMVCTVAFVVVLMTTLLGIQFSRIEEASSLSTSENSIEVHLKKWTQLCKLRPRVRCEITVE